MNAVAEAEGVVRDIAIDSIDIANPRDRNQKNFREIVESIRALGLKKPITVTPRHSGEEERYLLICGQGRVEAFQALGQSTIPANVIEASDEDAFVMSLVENIARRHHKPGELLESIRGLHGRGYDAVEISRKTALDIKWVRGILLLIAKGEDRLVSAVETGRIPMSTAISIVKADADDTEIQSVLQDAYESGELRGKKLMTVRRLIEERRHLGKRLDRRHGTGSKKKGPSSTSLVRAYNQEVERQKLLIHKADQVQQAHGIPHRRAGDAIQRR